MALDARHGDEIVATPRVKIRLEVEPSSIRKGGPPPTLSVHATLQAERPITVFTYSSIFNMRIAFQKQNFVIKDLTRQVQLPHDDVKLHRVAPQHYRGHLDEKYHITLRPNETMTFKHPVVRFLNLESDHQFELGVQHVGIAWWCWGSKEQVLHAKDEPRPVPETTSIEYDDIAPVEFHVEPASVAQI